MRERGPGELGSPSPGAAGQAAFARACAVTLAKACPYPASVSPLERCVRVCVLGWGRGGRVPPQPPTSPARGRVQGAQVGRALCSGQGTGCAEPGRWSELGQRGPLPFPRAPQDCQTRVASDQVPWPLRRKRAAAAASNYSLQPPPHFADEKIEAQCCTARYARARWRPPTRVPRLSFQDLGDGVWPPAAPQIPATDLPHNPERATIPKHGVGSARVRRPEGGLDTGVGWG